MSSSAFDDDTARDVPIAPRRWQLPRSQLVVALLVAAFFVVVGVFVTGGFMLSGASDGFSTVFFVLWWGGLGWSAVAWLRTANRVDLFPDGSLLISAPVRAVHLHVGRVARLRYARRYGDNRRPGFVLEGAGQRVSLPRRLVDRELVDALLAGSPGMELPERWW